MKAAVCTAITEKSLYIAANKRRILLIQLYLQRTILVYDKNSCVITARSCCRYSQFKAIPLTHGEEIDFMGQKFILYTYTALVYMEINTA